MSDPTTSPATAASADTNPFKAVAQLLQAVRASLAGVRNPGQAPRWVRIARIREYQGAGDYISKAVIPAVDQGFAFTVAYLAHLTLQARDLIVQADAAKALIEVSGEMLQVVTNDEFAQSLAEVLGQPAGNNPLRNVRTVIGSVATFVDKVPDPADLDLLSKELYGLLCLEQLPLDEAGLGAASETHLNLETSGKLRLLQMALDKSIRIRGLGKDKQGEQDLAVLGARRLWPAGPADLPVKTRGVWGKGPDVETIYEFSFAGDRVGEDIAEANALLEKLGYVDPAVPDSKAFDDALQRRLRRFQKVNGLVVSGQIDNSTLNRLQHLDFESKSLARAKPFDADVLKDFDDTRN